MKLEIKHIYAYMPYNLKCKLGNDILEIDNIKCILCTWLVYFKGSGKTWDYLSSIKLLLKPLSKLSEKEIKEVALKEGIHIENVLRYIRMNIVSYRTIQMLLEQHYDVFGLIDNGLAEVLCD